MPLPLPVGLASTGRGPGAGSRLAGRRRPARTPRTVRRQTRHRRARQPRPPGPLSRWSAPDPESGRRGSRRRPALLSREPPGRREAPASRWPPASSQRPGDSHGWEVLRRAVAARDSHETRIQKKESIAANVPLRALTGVRWSALWWVLSVEAERPARGQALNRTDWWPCAAGSYAWKLDRGQEDNKKNGILVSDGCLAVACGMMQP